ncbi:hypothetical protein AXL3_01 [Stenotrophomonas phage vB_SmaS-AXL_3]|uniref:Uncharacterized protein n=1 Tax=Stenotrophomonas phage vB_SmaS-AXL_3 TaxID=2740427 RepID=A0A7D5CKT9_9CAUD|nr:hypothetical protein PQE62_gp01 [Stenotrophomonas phage vB_SmaS-AXL_3]QKW95586.1 hypothetical protein AXL3_01 [Stenotrophomonas phage vB_SmaS-AXL_3]
MSRRQATTKPSAVRTKKPGSKVAKPVEASYVANERPRQPKIRQTPPRKAPPKPPNGRRPRGEDPNTIEGMDKRSRKLRVKREEISAETVEAARATGMLPHEWMLAVMRGEQINHFAYDSDTQEIIEVIVLPTFADRMEAAKSAAPYFANKLQPEKRAPGTGHNDPSKQPGVMEVPLVDSMEKWTEMAQQSQAVLKKKVTE